MNHLTFLLAIAPLAATAQAGLSPQPAHLKAAADSGKVYTYVERMPELPGGGGMGAVVGEVMKRSRLSAITDDGSTRWSGITISFIVNTDGTLRYANMLVSSNNRSIDKALLTAVRDLPKFTPGYQDGKAVPVRLTMRIACIKPQ